MLFAPLLSASVAWYPKEQFHLNLEGDYNFLEIPYYCSQDYEDRGLAVHPTNAEMLDAYVTPIFLQKAALAGIPVAEHYISNGYFEPPVVIDPINPFLAKSRVVLKPGREASTAKSLTRNHTYAMCCQEIPPGGRVVNFRLVLGWSAAERFRPLAQRLWQVFRIPLARVRVIELADGRILASDLAPLPLKALGLRERQHLDKEVEWENG